MIKVGYGDHGAGDRLTVEAPPNMNERIKQIPGVLWSRKEGCWTLPRRWPAAVALGVVAGEVGQEIHPDDEAAMWVAREKVHAARMTSLAELATVEPGQRSPLGRERSLFGHQDVGSAWLSKMREGDGVLLLDQTGTGKTRTVFAAVERLGREALPVLVLTLNSVKASWLAEAQEYGWDAGRVVVVGGSAAQRRKQLARVSAGEADCCILNWEALRLHTRISAFPGQGVRRCPECGGARGAAAVTPEKCQAHPRELNAVRWGLVVADEAHRLKNPKAAVTQAAWGLADGMGGRGRRVALTGTPIADTPEDLWPLLRWADPDGFPVKSAWVDRYCRSGFDWFGAWRVEGFKPERRAEFDSWWRPVNRRVRKDEVLDLPPLVRGGTLTRWLDMGTEQARAYGQMKRDMVVQLKGGTVTAQNLLVQVGRLMLLASACGTPGAKEGELELVRPSNKVDTLVGDLLAGDWGEGPVVVAMASRRLLRLLVGALETAGWTGDDVAVVAGDVGVEERTKGIEAFQQGRRRLLAMTFGAGGAGITLTAADVMILLQRSWSAIEMRQAMDRVHRIGSERHKSVSIVDYVSQGTVETVQIARVRDKEGVLEELVRDRAALLALLGG